ncbi:MAG: tryptophan synthase subunit alpha [Planctomycetes bacterium]|nr:tryptophan synthase subunit alpha [Planctomycetota bacterium]
MKAHVGASARKTEDGGRSTSDVPTNRIASCFTRLRAARKKAFIAYICAGDPTLDATVELVVEMAKAGVDIIELGIPYSDPMADGPANQAACERALAAGATVRGVLDAVRRIRARSDVPLLFFTYINPVLAYGLERFAADAAAAGVDGILPLDLPPEEGREFLRVMRAAGIANVCLSAPTTPLARKRMLARESRGFLYYVCRLGVTGERAELPSDLGAQVRALKAVATAPVCIGFGISTPEQAALAAGFGEGVIVGSHLVRLIEREGRDPRLAHIVAERAGELAAAVHAVKG